MLKKMWIKNDPRMGVFRFVRFGDVAKKNQKNMEKYEIFISKKNDHGFFLADFSTTVTYPVYIIHPWAFAVYGARVAIGTIGSRRSWCWRIM